jgi:phenylpropionate dioxygenase-like ring-hydroxylating dioxygenase large terminal subunit
MQQSGDGANDLVRRYDELVPEFGFREYWYPACLSRELGERPLAMTLMGEPMVFVRRAGHPDALANECPHRGTPLSRGRCEFPGTNTLTCAYHGWTFDVTNGNCVAALTDGPDSPVVNKVRVRTYPVTERQGIVWIWTGKQPPVAPETDIPGGLREAAIVLVVPRTVYGNWRWHIENPGIGHATILHRNALFFRFKRFPGFIESAPELHDEPDGVWLCEERGERFGISADYPGVGVWPRSRLGEGVLVEGMSPMFGVTAKVSTRLPAVSRVLHHPIFGSLYYEWYVQTDADHYIYFQVSCGFPRSARARRVSVALLRLGPLRRYRPLQPPGRGDGLRVARLRETAWPMESAGGTALSLRSLPGGVAQVCA